MTISAGIFWGSFMAVPVDAANKSLKSGELRFDIYGSAMPAESVYVMVGALGRMYRSRDAGATWEVLQSGTDLPLFSVSFPDEKHGWAVGKSGTILHTEDGGDSWKMQGSGTEKHLFSVSFSDDRKGCAVGDWSVILVTDDGGKTWRDVSLDEDVLLYGVCFRDREKGWVVGEFGRIFSTVNGGETWQAVSTGMEMEEEITLVDIAIDGESLYASGLDGLILYSRDSGKTWKKGRTETNKALYGISVRRQTGFAVGDKGTVLQTEDGGETWRISGAMKKTYAWAGTVELQTCADGRVRGFMAGARGLFVGLEQ